MGLIVNAIIQIAIAIIATVAFRPKPKTPDGVDLEQRGTNVPLRRIYGTRRVTHIATDEALSQTLRNPGAHTAAGLINFEIKYRTDDVKTFKRRNVLLVEGPLCLSGRQNAAFSGITNFRVNDKIYTDKENRSWSRFVPSSASAQIDLKGGTRLPFSVAHSFGGPNNVFSHMVHMQAQYVQDLKEKIVFNSSPKATLDLTANRLWSPSVDALANIDDPAGWTGRADNPFLQIMDLILDPVFGYNIPLSDFNQPSWQFCESVADVPIAVKTTRTNYEMFATDSFDDGGGFSNGFYNYDWRQIQTTFSPREMLTCHASLKTTDPLNEHIEELLLNTRGARIFNDREGKITCQPAWLHVDDRDQVISGENGAGPFRMAFIVEKADVRVTKNGALLADTEYNVTRVATFTTQVGYRFGTGQNDGPGPVGIDPDNAVGITFTTPLTPADTVVVLYDTIPSQPTAAHIISDPAHLGLDYDATVDADGVMLIRVDTEKEFGLNYVKSDGRYNQTTISFPDKDQAYETNQATWPVEGSAQHLAYLAEDYDVRYLNEIEVNTVTDLQDAMDFAEFDVRQSRSADVFVAELDRMAAQLEPNDLVKVTVPEAGEDGARLWRTQAIRVGEEFTSKAQFQRYEKEDYNYLVDDFGTEQTLRLSYAEQPVQNLTYSSVDPSGLISAGRLTWERALNSTPSGYLVEISNHLPWDAGTTYAIGDVVFSGEDHYRALAASTNSIPSSANTDWLELDDGEGWEFVVNTIGLSAATPPISNAREFVFRVTPLSALNQRGEAAVIVTPVTVEGIGTDGLDLIPPGGRVAGQLTCALAINTLADGSVSPGQVRIRTGNFQFPLTDGSIVSRDIPGDFQFDTPWEGAYEPFEGRGFLAWGPVTSVGRFAGVTYPNNFPYASGAYLREHLNGQWYVVDNAGNRVPFTPNADDVIIATCFKPTAATQIQTMSIHVPNVIDGSDGSDGAPGAPGSNGGFHDFIFFQSATQPATPTGDNPAGWVDGPTATGIWWQSNAFKTDAGALVGGWSTPVKVVGEDGTDGPFTDFIFFESNSQPATPVGDNPAGWVDGPTNSTGVWWQSSGAKTAAGVLQGAWSVPVRVTGEAGADGTGVIRLTDPIGVNGNGGSITLDPAGDVTISIKGSITGFVVGVQGALNATMKVFRNGVEIASVPYVLEVIDDPIGADTWFSASGNLDITISDTPPAGNITYTTQWSAGAWAQWVTESASPVLIVEEVK